MQTLAVSALILLRGDRAAACALKATSAVLSPFASPADLGEAGTRGIVPMAPVVEIERLRGFNGTPVCEDRTVVAQAKAPKLASTDLHDASLHKMLKESGFIVHRSSHTGQAGDARFAKLLKVGVGTPVLIGSETAYDSDGESLLLGRIECRGNAYRFEADLFRERTH